MRTKRILKAYAYYKQQYPGVVIFFRVMDNYEVYQEDAVRVGKILRLSPKKAGISAEPVIKLQFPLDEGYDHVETLYKEGVVVRIISKRDKTGKFSVPDIELIKKDRENDY
jgi:DNA mismatch repair ATPase MutS